MGKRVSRVSIVGGLAIAAVAGSARATLVASDSFESYTPGAALNAGSAGTNTTGPNGEFGWTGDWAAVTGVNIRSATVAASGGSRVAEVDDATNAVNAATRAFTPQTGTVYFSVLYNVNAGLEASDFVHFYLSNAAGAAANNNSGGIGDIDTGAAVFGARVGTTNGGATIDSPVTETQGTTYLLVGKLSKVSSTNYNRIDLFVNPAGATEPGTSDIGQTSDSGVATVSVFGLRTFNLDAGDKYQFDQVRIGTAFSDVAPEPATLGLLAAGGFGLLAAGGFGLLARRRRTA